MAENIGNRDIARIFVAGDPNHCDVESQMVLEWSVRKYASIDVEITWMMLSNDPESPFYGWDTKSWATTFSGLRWAVPELCNFEGRAIYCDSDVIFLADVRELWEQQDPLPAGKVAIGKGGNEWRMCVCLFDCERAKAHIPSIAKMREDSSVHGRMNQHFRSNGLVQPFQGDWNNLDARHGESLSDIKVLHYTCMNTQPQGEYAVPRLAALGRKHWFDGEVSPHPREDVRELFRSLLKEAADEGYTVDRYTQHPLFGNINKRSFKGRARV